MHTHFGTGNWKTWLKVNQSISYFGMQMEHNRKISHIENVFIMDQNGFRNVWRQQDSFYQWKYQTVPLRL